jgi:hypothetical protein
MSEPTPIRGHRRYTKRQKLSAVMAADMVGVVAASEQAGVPESTIRYWADRPEFAEYRAKAREDLEAEVGVVAHLAWQRVAEALRAGTLEPRDALFAADKATTLYQLVAGHATARTETRDITDTMTPEQRDALADEIDVWLRERSVSE